MIGVIDKKMWRWMLYAAVLLGAETVCHSSPAGPGMIVSFGSIIEGKSIDVKSSKMANGERFSNPGSVGGVGTSKWGTWRHIPTKVEAASGDGRGLPEWVEFEWSEPPYPEDPNMSLDAYRSLPRKTQRLEIKSRVPQDVLDEVVEAERHAPSGEVAEKSLWIYIFWTPEGVKMRWQLRHDSGHTQRNFGGVVREGGDNLDQYNREGMQRSAPH